MGNKPINQRRARLVVVVVFMLGALAGGLSLNLYERLTASGKAPDTVRPRDHAFDKLKKTLELSKDQQDSIRQIVDETFDKYGDIKKDVEPRIVPVRQAARDRIRAILSPDQLVKYEDMVREADDKRKLKE
jgi:hypothetical protein